MNHPETSGALWFYGGAVFDGECMLPEGMGVLVEQGRITAVAEVTSVAPERLQRARHIDTRGATLLPGLIDCHVHLCSTSDPDFFRTILESDRAGLALHMLQMAQETLRGGVTTVRDLGCFEFIDMPVRDKINAGEQLAASLLCAGKSITVTGGHAWSLSIEVDDAADIIAAVRENIDHGADVIKLIATGGVATPNVDPLTAYLSSEMLNAAVAEAHRHGKRVAVHAQGAEGIQRAIEAGAASIEHGFEITDALVERMVDQGVWLVPTLRALERTAATADQRMPAELSQRVARFSQMQQDSFRRLVSANGRIAMGTDAGTPFNYHGDNARELELMVEAGMTPLQALQSATREAADLLDLSDRGRIAVGYDADLLLVAGDPTENILQAAHKEHHLAVYKRGFDVFGILGRPSSERTSARFLHDDSPF